MKHGNAISTKPLSEEERRRLVAEVAAKATPKVRAALERIDFRQPTAAEKELAAKLTARALKLIGRKQAA